MTPVSDTVIRRMVEAIVEVSDPEQVILFGSRGRGDFTERSDVDLIVVEAAPFGPGRSRHRVMNRLYRAVAGFGGRRQADAADGCVNGSSGRGARLQG